MEKTIVLKKQEEVEALSKKISSAKTIVALDYAGLTVKEFESLRKELRKSGCDIKVYKNNIARRASEIAGYADLVPALKGPKAIAMSNDDVIAPAKIVYDFAKTSKKITIQGGVVEGVVASVEKINELATLPSYEVLLTQLAAGMLGTVRDLAIALHLYTEENANA